MKYVNSGVRKKDAEALVTGQPVYTDDLAPKDCLIVKLLRSPHAHALIEEIKIDAALKVPGIACILTYKDVPQDRFTMAGQTYPEFSPYDRLILDKRVRFVGDAVAIVAGETEAAVDKALKIIKVKYQVLDAILDFHDAKDNKILIHPEDNWESRFPVGADNKRNLCASSEEGMGNLEETFAKCKYVVEKTYHTKANQQAMMETFRSYTYLEHFGRLVIVSSTQVPFHVRRILGRALGIGASKVRVIKPRIGGGFGAKQTLVTEVYPAIVTIKTGRPAKLVYTRHESQICSSPRHEMEVKVKVGADEEGKFWQLIYLLYRILVHLENMDRQRLLCPDISQLVYIEIQRHIVLDMMLCIQIVWQQVLIVVMGQHRESLRWNPQLVNWQKRWVWIRL